MTALMDQEQERLEQPESDPVAEFIAENVGLMKSLAELEAKDKELASRKKAIRRQIRRGILPRYFLAKDKGGNGLERSGTAKLTKRGIRKDSGRLTLRQVGTMAYLTKESK